MNMDEWDRKLENMRRFRENCRFEAECERIRWRMRLGVAAAVAAVALLLLLAGCGGVRLVVRADGDCRVTGELGGVPAVDCGVRVGGESLPPPGPLPVFVETATRSSARHLLGRPPRPAPRASP